MVDRLRFGLLGCFLLCDVNRENGRNWLDKLGWHLHVSDVFSVFSVRHFLDERFLFTGGNSTRWNNYVSIKLNILLWRISLVRIPTRENLGGKGIILDSSLCPTCLDVPETIEHVFAGCKEVVDIWHLIARWWNVVVPYSCSVDSLIKLADNHFLAATRICFDIVITAVFWVLWIFYNTQIFGTVKPNKSGIFEEIVGRSFLWICNRRNNYSSKWRVWLQNSVCACNL